MNIIRLFLLGFLLVGFNPSWSEIKDGGHANTEIDYKAKFNKYRLLADQGDPVAIQHLGWLYENGYGVSQDYDEAARLYRLASSKISSAYVYLGNLYEKGHGVSQDYGEAARLYRIAARANDEYALRRLGKLYENGLGVQKNYIEAERFYRRAIIRDTYGGITSPMHYYDIAGLYEKGGHGISQSYSEAIRYYRKAAEGEVGIYPEKAKEKIKSLQGYSISSSTTATQTNHQTGRSSTTTKRNTINFILSTISLWVLGLSPAIAIRFIYKKPPFSIIKATSLSLIVWFTLYIVDFYLSYLTHTSDVFSRSWHPGILLITLTSIFILRMEYAKGKKVNMKPVWDGLTGNSLLSTIAGWVVFIILIAVIFNSWVFIAGWLGLPWSSTGYR